MWGREKRLAFLHLVPLVRRLTRPMPPGHLTLTTIGSAGRQRDRPRRRGRASPWGRQFTVKGLPVARRVKPLFENSRSSYVPGVTLFGITKGQEPDAPAPAGTWEQLT